MAPDDVRRIAREAIAEFIAKNGQEGIGFTKWCRMHAVSHSAASMFLNNKRAHPPTDLLAAVGLERCVVKSRKLRDQQELVVDACKFPEGGKVGYPLIRQLVRETTRDYIGNRKSSTGFSRWCRLHNVDVSAASRFMNGITPPGKDLLDVLGFERSIGKADVLGRESQEKVDNDISCLLLNKIVA